MGDMRNRLESMELCLGMEEPVESLWARIKERTDKSDIIVGVSYRPPDQEEQVDEALYRQVRAASHSQALTFSHGAFQPHQHLLEGQHSRI